MKKVYCNNLLAKVLLAFSSCHTITIGPFVLSKRPEEKITQKVRNHECTHARQWVEMAVATGTVIWILLLCFDLSAWWLVLAGLAFYLWYGVEWLVMAVRLKDAGRAAFPGLHPDCRKILHADGRSGCRSFLRLSAIGNAPLRRGQR